MRAPIDRDTEPYSVFPGNSEMACRMRAFDWSQTPLGPLAAWPQNLKTSVRIILTSRHPMFVWWGEQLINLYNDGYAGFLRAKHPWALGRPAAEVWPEIWDQVGPRAEYAMHRDEGTYDEAQVFILNRNGYPEETYFTFSYSPIPNDHVGIGGILCPVTEETQRIVGERQMALLRELAARAGDARTWQDACRLAAAALATDPHDLPFALIYLIDTAKQWASLAAATGITAGSPAAPEAIALDAPCPWPIAEVIDTDRPVLVADLNGLSDQLPTGRERHVLTQAVAIPIGSAGESGLTGVLVVGLNPLRRLDDGYQGFLELVAAEISAALNNSEAYQIERRRAEALAELDEAKTAFFSNVSHEFRTPLTLILGPLEDELRESPRPSARIKIAHRNCLRLLKLVNTLLNFSRIESGRSDAHYEPVDLAALTANLASSFRSVIEKAGMRLVVDCPPLPEPVYVDREMWETIVLNLLSNAFKFTWQGAIGVSLKTSDAKVTLNVRDTGAGIPAAELPRVFERFHRIKGVYGRTYEGSGIGLALVRELVKLHRGTIEVRSTVGKGSEFSVAIPLGCAHLPLECIGAAPSRAYSTLRSAAYAEEALCWLPDGSMSASDLDSHSKTDDPPLTTVTGARMLIAEDNIDMQRYLQQLLGPIGSIEAARDGESALAAALRDPPDLVLSDVMMPRIDGFELLRCLRQDPKTREVAVILLSAMAGQEARVTGIEAGADDYLVKPFSARELVARVETQIKLARMRREALRHEQEFQAEKADLLESMIEPLLMIDTNWQLTYVNAAAEAAHGVHRRYLLGKNLWDAFPALRNTAVGDQCRRAMADRESARFEYRHEPDGRWYDVVVFPISSGGIGIYGRDVNERKQMEEAIRHQAQHDALTGLPNRRLFMEILDGELAHARRSDEKFAVCLLDLDKFKFINDTLGHAAGDLLLREVAGRLRASVRESDIVARMGGDEFNVLVRDLQAPQDVVPVAQKILATFGAPVRLQGHELHLSTSIGISICPDDTDDLDALFKAADVAMYHAKAHGGGNYQFYSEEMNVRTIERLRLEHWLRQSLERGELVVHYQPRRSVASGEVVAAEALVRWRHPERGLIDPEEFIPLAEETGFITAIDQWVLHTACEQLKCWQETRSCPIKMAVNLSAKQFGQRDLVERVERVLTETGLDPHALEIEITESVAMAKPEETVRHMNDLANIGISVVVDDFGTGYSSLSYLKKLPISKLKIDKSFVKDIATDPDDRAIITAVTAMARTMQLGVIAEGVETEDQAEFLQSTGCEEMQGYLFSRPLSAQEFDERILAPT